ncbi:MAG: type II toxin-antitoxin system VapC family toxin [Microthrixaceae bacterium]|nr:type II toxin-antitoxin system VapC family toxin [Microthrixaceae bacterium]
MRIYADSSALIKRVVEEAESDALLAALDDHIASDITNDTVVVSSSLAWIEVSRALSSLSDSGANSREQLVDAFEVALSGVAERPITADVVSLARRVAPPVLRTLDAIHLATAILLDVDVVLTYDDRLADACRHNGLAVSTPGR